MADEERRQRQRTNEEAMQARQSAPKPTMEDGVIAEAQRLIQARIDDAINRRAGAEQETPVDARNGFSVLDAPVKQETIHAAIQTLQKYKAGKANLEARLVDNENWYKLRHWDRALNRGKRRREQVEPTSAWLFNSIINKHADAMDNFPSPTVLPREEADKGEAEMLTSILPVILQENDFEKTYDEVMLEKLKSGTGIYGVFWNARKNNIGDIDVKMIDPLNLFWEPGVRDIQDSRNLFHTALVDNVVLLNEYPQLQGKLGDKTLNVPQYVYDDTVDTTEKSVVVDWYYKKANQEGKQVLHYCKFVSDVILFSSENNPDTRERGFYDHGKYPFVFDPLFRVMGTPAGFGYIDVGKSAQEYIDRGGQAILQNMLANSRPRHFIRSDGSVNEEEYADMTKDFIHVDGNLGQDSILPVQGKPLSNIYVQVINDKIAELKETTGNRDVSQGGTTGGVTAASAIAAMMEAGSKLSRDSNKAAYRAFREIILLCIELIRQFYDMPRCFRIVGENGMMKFVQYSNARIAAQAQGVDFGIDMGYRLPLFDVEVVAEKASPYSKMSQNELALQFYQAGFFNPMMADQALLCLDMMDFDRKDFVMQKIAQSSGMLQQMMMLAQMVDAAHGGNEISSALAQQYGMGAPAPVQEQEEHTNTKMPNDDSKPESHVTANARKRVAESTVPT